MTIYYNGAVRLAWLGVTSNTGTVGLSNGPFSVNPSTDISSTFSFCNSNSDIQNGAQIPGLRSFYSIREGQGMHLLDQNSVDKSGLVKFSGTAPNWDTSTNKFGNTITCGPTESGFDYFILPVGGLGDSNGKWAVNLWFKRDKSVPPSSSGFEYLIRFGLKIS